MTHKDIYTKFMIEYDKADITSSYPPLTKYEIAVTLDKAYLALIAQKITGNNPRQSVFEGDIKSIMDLQPLIKTITIYPNSEQEPTLVENEISFNVPNDMLYYVSSVVTTQNTGSAIDNMAHRKISAKLITHNAAEKFKSSTNNLPWITNPVLYIENNKLIVLYDIYANDKPSNLNITYLSKPNLFVSDNLGYDFSETSIFQLSDTIAEELISLAILMAAKIVQSPRLETEVQTKSLES